MVSKDTHTCVLQRYSQLQKEISQKSVHNIEKSIDEGLRSWALALTVTADLIDLGEVLSLLRGPERLG